MWTLSFLNPFANKGAGKPAPLPLGESGASSVKGRVRAARSAAWMPFTETGRSPGTKNRGIMDDADAQVVTLAGSCFCPGSPLGWAAP
jgi:hypothetical protein